MQECLKFEADSKDNVETSNSAAKRLRPTMQISRTLQVATASADWRRWAAYEERKMPNQKDNG